MQNNVIDAADENNNLETLRSMRRQEQHYRVSDYLSDLPARQADPDNAGEFEFEPAVDASCRLLMGKWFSEVAGAVRFDRETVAATVNYLDRFASTPAGKEVLLDRNQYQLAAMTALYTNLKIHEKESMDLDHVSMLSRGAHSPEAVEAMELRMITAVRWRMYRPTPMFFVETMIDAVQPEFSSYERSALLDTARTQIEMTVNEYEFCTYDASKVALACLLNAVNDVVADDDMMLQSTVETTIGPAIDADGETIQDLRIAMYELMDSDESNSTMRASKTRTAGVGSPCGGGAAVGTKRNNIHSSPRTVVAPSSASNS